MFKVIIIINHNDNKKVKIYRPNKHKTKDIIHTTEKISIKTIKSIFRMNNVDNINSPIGTLVEILTNAQKMNSFEFDDMTTTLVNMWAEPQHPLGRSIIDYVIMAAQSSAMFS